MSSRSGKCGVLVSGGLDSCVLVAEMLRTRERVVPFYVRTDVVWATAELTAVRRYLAVIDSPQLADLVVLEMPLRDLYGQHWSITGQATPDDRSPDEDVFLPGRNALLAIKPLVYCQEHGIEELAIGVLDGNAFADARPEFLEQFASAMALGSTGPPVRLTRPYAKLAKRDVLARGVGLPLELTFSCISPRDGLHCGRCNKCGERRVGFQQVGLPDRTPYIDVCSLDI